MEAAMEAAAEVAPAGAAVVPDVQPAATSEYRADAGDHH